METHMLGRAQDNKVRQIVVGLVSVNVVDMFVTVKGASEMLLHNVAVLIDAIVHRLGMGGHVKADIASAINVAATAPLRSILAILSGDVPARTTTEPASYPGTAVLKLARVNLERVTALITGEGKANTALPLIGFVARQRALVCSVATSGAETRILPMLGTSEGCPT